jgi:hypothetical protein
MSRHIFGIFSPKRRILFKDNTQLNNLGQEFLNVSKQYEIDFQSKLNRDGTVLIEMLWRGGKYEWIWGNFARNATLGRNQEIVDFDDYIDILNCFGNKLYQIPNYLQTVIENEKKGREITRKIMKCIQKIWIEIKKMDTTNGVIEYFLAFITGIYDKNSCYEENPQFILNNNLAELRIKIMELQMKFDNNFKNNIKEQILQLIQKLGQSQSQSLNNMNDTQLIEYYNNLESKLRNKASISIQKIWRARKNRQQFQSMKDNKQKKYIQQMENIQKIKLLNKIHKINPTFYKNINDLPIELNSINNLKVYLNTISQQLTPQINRDRYTPYTDSRNVYNYFLRENHTPVEEKKMKLSGISNRTRRGTSPNQLPVSQPIIIHNENQPESNNYLNYYFRNNHLKPINQKNKRTGILYKTLTPQHTTLKPSTTLSSTLLTPRTLSNNNARELLRTQLNKEKLHEIQRLRNFNEKKKKFEQQIQLQRNQALRDRNERKRKENEIESERRRRIAREKFNQLQKTYANRQAKAEKEEINLQKKIRKEKHNLTIKQKTEEQQAIQEAQRQQFYNNFIRKTEENNQRRKEIAQLGKKDKEQKRRRQSVSSYGESPTEVSKPTISPTVPQQQKQKTQKQLATERLIEEQRKKSQQPTTSQQSILEQRIQAEINRKKLLEIRAKNQREKNERERRIQNAQRREQEALQKREQVLQRQEFEKVEMKKANNEMKRMLEAERRANQIQRIKEKEQENERKEIERQKLLQIKEKRRIQQNIEREQAESRERERVQSVAYREAQQLKAEKQKLIQIIKNKNPSYINRTFKNATKQNLKNILEMVKRTQQIRLNKERQNLTQQLLQKNSTLTKNYLERLPLDALKQLYEKTRN